MTDKETHGMVTSAVVGQKRRLVSSRTVILAAVVLFTIVLVATGLVLSRQSSTNTPKNAASTAKAVATPPVTPESKADALAQKGDYPGAQKLLAAELEKTNDTKSKAALYLSQATIALNAANYADAKTYATAADKLTPTSNTSGLLGSIAAESGDKTAALSYYQQAIKRLDKNADNYSTSQSDYNTRIQELQ